MGIRIGIVRGLVAALAVLVLVVPVGLDAPSGPEPASVGEALVEMASGRLGVGVLSGLVAGGELASAALVRLLLFAAAVVAFLLAGSIRVRRVEEPSGRRRCPHCGKWASARLRDCPHCGRALDGQDER